MRSVLFVDLQPSDMKNSRDIMIAEIKQAARPSAAAAGSAAPATAAAASTAGGATPIDNPRPSVMHAASTQLSGMSLKEREVAIRQQLLELLVSMSDVELGQSSFGKMIDKAGLDSNTKLWLTREYTQLDPRDSFSVASQPGEVGHDLIDTYGLLALAPSLSLPRHLSALCSLFVLCTLRL